MLGPGETVSTTHESRLDPIEDASNGSKAEVVPALLHVRYGCSRIRDFGRFCRPIRLGASGPRGHADPVLQINAHCRGDRKSVEDQATQALIGPTSFGNPDYDFAMNEIKAIPGYPEMFGKAFPGEQDRVTPENWG